MSPSLLIGCLWVVAAAITALLPMKRQFPPGIALLIAAPFLLIWIGATQGWLWLAVGLFAFVSMFRRPLIYFGRRALGLTVTDPRERT